MAGGASEQTAGRLDLRMSEGCGALRHSEGSSVVDPIPGFT